MHTYTPATPGKNKAENILTHITLPIYNIHLAETGLHCSKLYGGDEIYEHWDLDK